MKPAHEETDAAGGLEQVARSVAPAVGPWADAFGRAGSRTGQTILIALGAAGAIWLLLQVKVVVIAVLVALILASAVSPLVRWLTAKGWSHLWATVVAFLGILLVVGGMVAWVVMAVRNEWNSLVASALEGWNELQAWIASGPLPVDASTVDAAARQLTEFVAGGGLTQNIATNALTGLGAATEFLTGATLMVVILFFFLKDGHRMWNFTLRWFRGERRAKLAESVDRSAQILGGYVRGTALIALVDAVLIGIGLAIVGVPLALPLAVIVFIGAFIPIVGATVAGLLAALVALVTNGPVQALIVVGIVVLVNQLEGDLLQPIVMGRTLSLHALVVLLALTVGTIVGGIFGAILAVPYTAVGWAVVQVWSTRYQAGPDPVLGEDPLDPNDRASDKATRAQRMRYRAIRWHEQRGRKLGAVDQDTAEKDLAPGDHQGR
ncbi:AI-2E family transporter [Arthrobacter ginkgonis]|uniref:AI-2E family transporter n=1 Tax=Arthrobacter ginkgonis TaxID=1630594 RepID=A0ABP7BQG6_9MICC